MRRVAIFLSDELTIRRLRLAFRGRCSVHVGTDAESLRDSAMAGQLIAIIVDLQRTDTMPARRVWAPVELIARLHVLYPAVPIVGYVDFTPERARDILLAAHAGATEIILREYDNLDHIATRIMDLGVMAEVAARVTTVLKTHVPAHLHDLFLASLAGAMTNSTVDQLAVQLHRHRRTLTNWLAEAHLPSPSRVMGWARVLLAARMLEMSDHSAERVVTTLRFMSRTALGKLLRRYLGCGPNQLRRLGGFDYALRCFTESLEGTRHLPE